MVFSLMVQIAILFPANSFGALRQVGAQSLPSVTPAERSLSHLAPQTFKLSVSPHSVSATAAGKTGTVRVITSKKNNWTVINSNSWIVVTPASGRGSKRLKYSVSPNFDCASRTGTFSVNGKTVTIHQASAPKNYFLSASNAIFSAQAAASNVTLNADCIWTIQTDADWISTVAPASDSGDGSATIFYAVAANLGVAPRTGQIKILDGNSTVRQTLSVTQQGLPSSSFSFSPSSVTLSTNGGSGEVNLTAPDNVRWTIRGAKGFTNISPTNGTGSASIRFSILPNPSDEPLTNSIVVVDENETAQTVLPVILAPVSASAQYSLNSSYLVFTADGGNVSVGLTANASWTAQSDVDWINNIIPASGGGNAVIHYSVAPNATSGSRTGSIRILDGNSVVRQTLKITQGGAAANFALSAATTHFAAEGGSGNLSLAANSSWKILTDVDWINGISATSGTGDATIHYSIGPNTNSAARSSSIRVLDGNFIVKETLVITQDGAPEKYSLASGGNAPAGYRWSATLGTSGNDVGNSIATDSQGNVLVTGNLDNFVFIEKYSASGVLIWSKTFYDNPGSGNAIAVDRNDNVFVAGTFAGALDFGGGPLFSAGGYDSFVVKFSSDGTQLWSKRFGGSEGDDSARGLAVDSLGNVLVTGSIVGTVTLGSSTTFATGPFDNDIVLAKLSANGDFIWSKRFASTTDDNGLSVSVGPQDEVVLTGNFSGPINFGTGVLTSREHDVFLAKFSANGTPVWSKQFGGALRDSGNGVAVDADGNIVLTGAFAGTIDFGGGALNSANANYDDIFLAKFAGDGSLLWSQSFGGNLFDRGNAVSVDQLGNIALVGSFYETIDLGGGALKSTGGSDIFVAKYSPDGAHLWSKSFGAASGIDDGRAVTVDSQNNIITTGQFFSVVDFGGGAQASGGLGDMLMVSLAP